MIHSISPDIYLLSLNHTACGYGLVGTKGFELRLPDSNFKDKVCYTIDEVF